MAKPPCSAITASARSPREHKNAESQDVTALDADAFVGDYKIGGRHKNACMRAQTMEIIPRSPYIHRSIYQYTHTELSVELQDYGQMDGLGDNCRPADGWMDGWIDGLADGSTGRSMNRSTDDCVCMSTQ